MGQIEALIARAEAAWNRGDIADYVACYADDAGYISRAGELWTGREQIRQGHEAAFDAGLRGTQLKITLRRTASLSDSIAVVHADVELKGATALWAVTTFVIRDGLIAAAHTTEI